MLMFELKCRATKPLRTSTLQLYSCIASMIVLVLSCDPNLNTASIDLSRNDNVSVKDVFSNISVIQLESLNDNMITDISRIHYYNSHYYLLDERSQKIFCFDENGCFVYKIDSQGKGRGEYHYITDLAIDDKKERLVVLDPVVQRVHFFDLNGKFINSYKLNNDKVFGLNRVYPMNDSLLIFTSLTFESLIFYSLNDEKILYSDFSYDVPSTLHAFSPNDNVYVYNDQLFFLPPLEKDVFAVTNIIPELSYSWCFGINNNSKNDITRLLQELELMETRQDFFSRASLAVGKNKFLKHHIMKPFENERFRIAVLEFDNDFMFVLIDKIEKKEMVFRSFSEGIRFPFQFMQSDRVITPFQPPLSPREKRVYEKGGVLDYYQKRSHLFYSSDILSEKCRLIVENHNPMTDNPFLVVYKFRE